MTERPTPWGGWRFDSFPGNQYDKAPARGPFSSLGKYGTASPPRELPVQIVITTIVTACRAPFESAWWTERSPKRRLKDIGLACVMAWGIFVTAGCTIGLYAVYPHRDTLYRSIAASWVTPVLDFSVARTEADAFLSSTTARSGLGVLVIEVSIADNRRSTIGWSAVPSHRDYVAQVVANGQDVPFISETAPFTLPQYRDIFEGRFFWSNSDRYARLVIPIPPVAGEQTVGILVVLCDLGITAADREVMEARATKFAFRLAGL